MVMLVIYWSRQPYFATFHLYFWVLGCPEYICADFPYICSTNTPSEKRLCFWVWAHCLQTIYIALSFQLQLLTGKKLRTKLWKELMGS